MTKEGACAVIGNMAAESGMKPNIAQRGLTTMSDEQYTAAADSGSIDFANDSVGYGLCQWTFHTRKAGLLSHAKARALSVGDETAQVTYCIVELMKDYPVLWKQLCSSHELYALTEAVCTLYERPAINNVKARYDYAQQAMLFFAEDINVPTTSNASTCEDNNPCPQGDHVAIDPASVPIAADPRIAVLELLMANDGFYTGELDGKFTAEFRSSFREYARIFLGEKEIGGS